MNQIESRDRFTPHKNLWPLAFVIGAKVSLDFCIRDLNREDGEFFSGRRISRRTFFETIRYYSRGILEGGVLGIVGALSGIEILAFYNRSVTRVIDNSGMVEPK